MAILCLTVPKKIALELEKIPVPGKKQDPSSYHITLFYMPNLKVDQISQLLKLTFEFLQNEKPFDTDLKEVTTFKMNDDGIPIIIPTLSDYLHDWRARLATELDKAGIEFSKKYPEFKPHLTLSYSNNKKDQNFKYKLPKAISVNHNTVTYYAGSHTGGTMFRIPIGSKKKEFDLAKERINVETPKNQNSTISFWEKS